MMTREQLQQIRILIYAAYCEGDTEAGALLVVIDAALAAPEPRPFCYHDGVNVVDPEFANDCDVFPLYTHPMPEPAAQHARDAVAWTPETGYVFAPDKNTSHAPAPQPIYMFRRKGLDDFCTCTKSRYDELSRKPHLFETKIAYTDPVPAPQREWVELEDDEVTEIADRCIDVFGLADLISEALRAKNEGKNT